MFRVEIKIYWVKLAYFNVIYESQYIYWNLSYA